MRRTTCSFQSFAEPWTRVRRNKRPSQEYAFSNDDGSKMQSSIWHRYAYGWITLAFFVITIVGHWTFAWFAFVGDQQAHQQPIQISEFIIQTSRDTLENWQSEFLQLLWQVGGLALLLYVGSPQSKEGDNRQEAKLDAILKAIDPENAPKTISSIDRRHGR
jgi:hypothetical protein